MADSMSIIDFRVFQSRIAKKLSETDRQSLVSIYRDYLSESLKEASALKILPHLETVGIFTPNNFVDVLLNLDRNDLAKEAEKFLKQHGVKAHKPPKSKGKKTPQIPILLTPRDAALKAKFDHVLLLASLLVEQLEKLIEALAYDEDHHQDSEELLKQCGENAAKLERELRKARSASKLSDNSFSDATNVGLVTALKNVVSALMPDGMPCQPSSVLELERAAHSTPNSPLNTGTVRRGAKKQPMTPPLNRKPTLQSHMARTANGEAGTETGDGTGGEVKRPSGVSCSGQDSYTYKPPMQETCRPAQTLASYLNRVDMAQQGTPLVDQRGIFNKTMMANDENGNETGDRIGGENCELYDTRDLLQDKPYLRADINVNYRRRAHSLPNSPKQIRKTPPARAERTVSPALSRRPKVSNSIQQTNSTCNYDPATVSTLEYTTPDQSTEGGTGDSGFEEPLLKVPLNPKVHAYTPLSEDTIERVEDVVYDTAEDQRTSHKGIMNQEHVYENFPSRESKSRQQLISKCK